MGESEMTMDAIQTSMLFLEQWDKKIENPFLRSNAIPGFEHQNFNYERYNVAVRDVREFKDTLTLDENGFAFLDEPQGAVPEMLEKIRQKDQKAIKELYYPVVVELIKNVTKASNVVIFDHTVRQRVKELVGKSPEGREQPAFSVHVDQSPAGAVRRVHQMMEHDAARLLKKRCQILNVWRPLNGPVDDWPLGLMDARSLSATDCHPTLLWRQGHDFRGSTMFITHHSSQQWCFLEKQDTHEITIIKIWDNGNVAAKCCAHCAFEDPRTSSHAPLRESIEVRCLVFYDEDLE